MSEVVTIDAPLLESGDVAKALGCTPQTVRNWEDRNLVPSSLRTVSGRRLYRPEDVEAIKRLRATRTCGPERRNRRGI